MTVLAAGAVIGDVRLRAGLAAPRGTYVTLARVACDLLVLSILLRAARYRGPRSRERTRT